MKGSLVAALTTNPSMHSSREMPTAKSHRSRPANRFVPKCVTGAAKKGMRAAVELRCSRRIAAIV